MFKLLQVIGFTSAALLAMATVVRSAETEVALETPAGTLHGTLLTPDKVDSPPFALIHPGSGPTDRDGNSAALPGKNNSLKYLAEALEKKGIASLRIDKRGIAASLAAGLSEADLRFQTYVDDGVAWMTELRQTHKAERLIMLGHSEGALIGALAAKVAKADGYISIAGVGQATADLLRSQLASKLPPFLMEKAEAAIAELEAGRLLEKPPRGLGALFRPSVQPYMISWFAVDPLNAVAALDCPVLIVQGTTDLQVSAKDGQALATANEGAQLVLIDGMNHLMKNVDGGLAKQLPSYSNPDLPISPALVDALVAFIQSPSTLPLQSLMWEHLTAPPNLVFGIALILLLTLFVLQLVGLLLGSELFSWMDSIMPDMPDLDLDVDLDASAAAGSAGFIDHLFALLNLGRVPLIISVIVFLFLFSCIGYNMQFILHEMGLPYLPMFGASAISFIATLPLLRFSNAGLARILPKDESEAVSADTFIGRVATITIGTVTSEKQSEARLSGPLGRAHYIQVICDNEGVEFHQGDEVLVVGRKGSLFTIIAVSNPQLQNDTFERKSN